MAYFKSIRGVYSTTLYMHPVLSRQIWTTENWKQVVVLRSKIYDTIKSVHTHTPDLSAKVQGIHNVLNQNIELFEENDAAITLSDQQHCIQELIETHKTIQPLQIEILLSGPSWDTFYLHTSTSGQIYASGVNHSKIFANDLLTMYLNYILWK
eukprot:414434_1